MNNPLDAPAQAEPTNGDGLDLPACLVRNKPAVSAERQQPEQGDASAETPGKKSWRDILPVHPACAAFRDFSHEDLVKMGEDILARHLEQPIVIHKKADGTLELLDGKNRLDAMELVGITFEITKTEKKLGYTFGLDAPDGVITCGYRGLASDCFRLEYELSDRQIADLVIALNVHRRHLSTADKQRAIVALLKADPQQSDRHTRGRAQPVRKAKAKSKLSAAEAAQIERTSVALDGKVAKEQRVLADKPSAEAARIESEQLDNLLKNADFGADVVVESPSIVMTDAGPRPVPAASDDAENPLDVLCAEWARSGLKSRFDALEPTDQVAFLDFLRNTIGYN